MSLSSTNADSVSLSRSPSSNDHRPNEIVTTSAVSARRSTLRSSRIISGQAVSSTNSSFVSLSRFSFINVHLLSQIATTLADFATTLAGFATSSTLRFSRIISGQAVSSTNAAFVSLSRSSFINVHHLSEIATTVADFATTVANFATTVADFATTLVDFATSSTFRSSRIISGQASTRTVSNNSEKLVRCYSGKTESENRKRKCSSEDTRDVSRNKKAREGSFACSVCLDSYRETLNKGAHIVALNCEHKFCNVCTNNFKHYKKCPLCRARILEISRVRLP